MTATTIIAENISTTNLAAINSDLGAITAGSLNIGSGNSTVSTAGVMTATGATVSGNITATSLTLSGTSIAESQLASDVQKLGASRQHRNNSWRHLNGNRFWHCNHRINNGQAP